MLIRFSVENFRSFRNRTDLRMDATADTDLQDVVREKPTGMPENIRGILPVASIHGANASGKSNVVKALSAIDSLVNLAIHFPGGVIPEELGSHFGLRNIYEPFRLDETSEQQPVFLEVEFLTAGKRWVYGVKFDATAILSEWLINWPNSRYAVVFARGAAVEPERRAWLFDRSDASTGDLSADRSGSEVRELNSDSERWRQESARLITKGEEPWYWGKEFEKGDTEGQALASRTRVDVPFLSTAGSWNHPQALQVLSWFNRLRIMDATTNNFRSSELTARSCENNVTLHHWVEQWMRASDLGISSIRFEARPENTRNRNRFQTKAVHLTDGGREVEFDMQQESHGTSRLFSLAVYLYQILNSGGVFVIDELHAGLHPLLLRALTKIFQSKKHNPKDAQLIFTTHDVCVLDNSLLRRDQIHIVEKDRSGASEMFSVSDCEEKPRKNSPLMKYYLSGNLGGIPDLDIESIFVEPKSALSGNSA